VCCRRSAAWGGWSFGRGGVFWGKRRHHQRGKNKTVNIFECVVAIGAASDGSMWAEKGVNGGWEWEFRVQEGGNVGGPAGFLSSVF